MGSVKLIATKRLRYRTRALAVGERFEAPDREAWILAYVTKKAKFAEDEPTPAPKPVSAPPPAPPHVVMPEDRELEQLRATARRLSIDVDNRWGARRLEAEIAAKRSPRGPAS
jgi:hypothetical protein